MISFTDLKAQQQILKDNIHKAINNVLNHGQYIMGPEVFILEERLQEYTSAKHAITCSNGTDAIIMSLMAHGITNGDAVFLPDFTFTATPESVAILGATPVFVDVDRYHYNIDVNSLDIVIKKSITAGLKPKAIIAVDLFGQPCDYDSLYHIARKYKLFILGDAAQSFGGIYKKSYVGTLADITTTSFFPAKPLGCYGDGGAIFTDDDNIASILKSLRIHGKGTHKYNNIRIGFNARLDTIQAAILLTKLTIFKQELQKKQKLAEIYNNELMDIVSIPYIKSDIQSAWAQYTIVLPHYINRDNIVENLKNAGIPTAIYYPSPLHQQQAYSHFANFTHDHLVNSRYLAQHVISLPMHAYITECEAIYICQNLKKYCC